MSTITTLPSAINASKSVIDTNFTNLNTDKAELSGGTFTGDISVPDEAYGVGWNGSTEVPTKNALYDKIETISGGGSVATDSIWDAKGDLAVGTGANTASRLAVGTNGQILVADSAEATGVKWATASGSGDMLAATYDPANIAQQVVGTTATQTISGKTLTAPKFVDNGFIADSNGNEMVSFNQNASAVNYLEIENGATGNPTHLRAMGDDTNIGLHLVGKGTGEVSVCDATDETKRIRFQVSGNSTGVITTLASSDTTSHTITLPNATDTLVGKATTDTLTNKDISSATNTYRAASLTATGAVELATTAEIDTGTDTTRAMPVDQFVASKRNVRYIDIYAVDKATDNAVGTNIIGSIECPFTGTITEIGAYVETAGVTGASVWDVNKNGTTIMTTNKLSIDSTEVSTRTAATAPTLTTTAITAGDLITIDTDSLSTTKPKGLHVRIGIRLT